VTTGTRIKPAIWACVNPIDFPESMLVHRLGAYNEDRFAGCTGRYTEGNKAEGAASRGRLIPFGRRPDASARARLLLAYIVHLAPVVVVTMAMMPTPTGADRYRHNASLGYKRNCQEQQHDPQIAHKAAPPCLVRRASWRAHS
jgi:hypothetical protein